LNSAQSAKGLSDARDHYRNYTTTKNKKKHTERLETKKFCNSCRKHTAHKEVK